MLDFILNLRMKHVILIFSSTLILFFVRTYMLNERETLPTIVWWTPELMTRDNMLLKCPSVMCNLTKSRSLTKADAFIFYGSHFSPHDLPERRFNEIWALIHEESPRNSPLFLYEEIQDLFNLTATFSRYSNLPLTLQYLKNLDVITELTHFVSVEEKNRFDNISAILYLQSDCDTPIGRDHYVRELMKYVKVDSYGSCLKNKDLPTRLQSIDPLDFYNPEILDFIGKYKFVIAFENAICDDYITEKLWRALIVGSIPIYYGSPSVQDWLPNNNSAILAKDFPSPKALADYILKADQSDVLYNSFLDHKLKNKISNLKLQEYFHKFGEKIYENMFHEFECLICQHLHQSLKLQHTVKTVYNCPVPKQFQNEDNYWIRFWRYGKCQSMALIDYLNKGKRFTSDDAFRDEWSEYLKSGLC